MNNRNIVVRRGNIFYADLNPFVGSEQGGIRPVIILQNDIGNKYSPTVIVACLTSKECKHTIPTHATLKGDYKNVKNSIILLEQIRTIDKSRLLDYVDNIDEQDMLIVDKACLISMGLDKYIYYNRRKLFC